MNTINWKPKAFKQIEKIRSAAIRKKIFTEIQSLVYFPNCRGVKRLINHDHSYRLRIGDYRVFFEFDGNIHIIDIEEVKKRDERTY